LGAVALQLLGSKLSGEEEAAESEEQQLPPANGSADSLHIYKNMYRKIIKNEQIKNIKLN